MQPTNATPPDSLIILEFRNPHTPPSVSPAISEMWPMPTSAALTNVTLHGGLVDNVLEVLLMDIGL